MIYDFIIIFKNVKDFTFIERKVSFAYSYFESWDNALNFAQNELKRLGYDYIIASINQF